MVSVKTLRLPAPVWTNLTVKPTSYAERVSSVMTAHSVAVLKNVVMSWGRHEQVG